MSIFQNIKIVIPVIHRRERRSFQLVIYGLNLEEAQNIGREAIYDRLERRGFSVMDWSPVWNAVHAEHTEYQYLSINGRRPCPRGVTRA